MPAGSLKRILVACGYLAILAGLYMVRLHSYLLFHNIVEMFSVSVAFAIFMIVWNGRRFMQNDYLLFIGIAYLFVGGLDLTYMLAYPGMTIFRGHGTNLSIQLWVSARYLESLSLLIAPFFLRQRLKVNVTVPVYISVFSILILSIFRFGVFPTCFDEKTGLTLFNEVSDHIIIGILIVSLILLLRERDKFDPKVLQFLSCSIGFTILSELMSTMYTRPYEAADMLAHLLKFISFFLIYRALIETGLKEPYNLLFRELKQSEQELKVARDELETRVQQRTAELAQSEKRFRMMAETIPDVFWMSTPKMEKMLYVSPAYEKIWGRSIESLYESPESLIEAINPEDVPKVIAALDDCEKEFWDLEYRINRADCSIRWIRDRRFPIRDEQRKVYLIAGVATDITQLKLTEKRILAHQEQLRDLTAELQVAEEAERRKIASELHDSVGQILAFLKIELGDLPRVGLSKEAANVVRHIREQVERAIKQTRTLTFEMSPPELYTLGLGPAIEELAQRFGESRNLKCSVEDCDNPTSLTDYEKILLYRSVRELLINAAKHAQASAVEISICVSDDELRITVADDGVGFDVARLDKTLNDKRKGFGLFSIRERLQHVGGRLYIQSGSGKGTRIILFAPLEHKNQESRSQES